MNSVLMNHLRELKTYQGPPVSRPQPPAVVMSLARKPMKAFDKDGVIIISYEVTDLPDSQSLINAFICKGCPK